MYIETMSNKVQYRELKYDIDRQDTFRIYSLLTSSQGILPLGENIEAFQRAPLATITDEAPVEEQRY